jgi:prophage maintenance system killer protein
MPLLEHGNPHQCLSTGKIVYFYLVKAYAFLDGNKRTGALTAITFFLNMYGLDLDYPLDIEKEINGMAANNSIKIFVLFDLLTTLPRLDSSIILSL